MIWHRRDEVETDGDLCSESCPQLRYVPGAPLDYYKCELFGAPLGTVTAVKRDSLLRAAQCRKQWP